MAYLGAQLRRNALGREDTWPPFWTGMNKHTSSRKQESDSTWIGLSNVEVSKVKLIHSLLRLPAQLPTKRDYGPRCSLKLKF